jgi:tRNA (cmo5U34)-methyltransferase
MSKFEKTQWIESEFTQNYRDDAKIYLPFRSQFIFVTKSIYSYFNNVKSTDAKILDLGCGDGLFIQEFLKSFSPLSVTLIDGSSEMLESAKKRLKNKTNTNFINSTFQELLKKKSLKGNFNFIFSSLAIHHLSFVEKKQLYKYIYKLLSKGGLFLNYDVVIHPSKKTEKYYLSLWRQWIEEQPSERSKMLLGIPEQYKKNRDNIPDTLKLQLETLEKIGFKDVDCYFKYGLFVLFGGIK